MFEEDQTNCKPQTHKETLHMHLQGDISDACATPFIYSGGGSSSIGA